MDILEPSAQGTPPVAAKTERALAQTPPFCHLKGAPAATHAPGVAFLVMARSFWALSSPVRDARARSDACSTKLDHVVEPYPCGTWRYSRTHPLLLPSNPLMDSHAGPNPHTLITVSISDAAEVFDAKAWPAKGLPLLLGRELVSVWLQSDRGLFVAIVSAASVEGICRQYVSASVRIHGTTARRGKQLLLPWCASPCLTVPAIQCCNHGRQAVAVPVTNKPKKWPYMTHTAVGGSKAVVTSCSVSAILRIPSCPHEGHSS